jgi:hypothetical protein
MKQAGAPRRGRFARTLKMKRQSLAYENGRKGRAVADTPGLGLMNRHMEIETYPSY